MTKKKSTNVLFISSMLLLLFLLGGCAKKSPGPVDDLAKLEGTWIGPEIGGSQGDWTFIFSGNHVSVNGPTQESYTGTVQVNSKANPKRVDFIIEECSLRDNIGKTSLGIYELQEEKLALAASEPGASTRPASFQEKGDGHFWVLKKK
ncbi:MAG: TIGR03067 domain-containing protein [Phycisphaerae bacterium]